jgi:hypothetical protein
MKNIVKVISLLLLVTVFSITFYGCFHIDTSPERMEKIQKHRNEKSK